MKESTIKMINDLNPKYRLAGEIWDKIEPEERIEVFKLLGYKNMCIIWDLDPMTMQWDGIARKSLWYPKLAPVILRKYGEKNGRV